MKSGLAPLQCFEMGEAKQERSYALQSMHLRLRSLQSGVLCLANHHLHIIALMISK